MQTLFFLSSTPTLPVIERVRSYTYSVPEITESELSLEQTANDS